MASKAQKSAGYPIPEEHQTEETQSFCIIIPAGEEFRQAAYAQLLMLGKWWKWKHDEEPESLRAKHTSETWRLLFEFNEDCGGGFPVTPEEFYDANKRAIYDAVNDIAKQIVSGRVTNIMVGEDGEVTDPTEGSEQPVEIPEDDPATPSLDENAAARAGGVNAVRRGLNLIWTDMNAWKSAAVPTADMIFRLKVKYLMNEDPLTEQFVVAYEAAWPSKINSYTETLEGMLYCGTGNFKNIIAEYILGSISAPLQPEAFALNAAISDAQITEWYQAGVQVPSTMYETYPCSVVQDETLIFDMAPANNPQRTTSEQWKVNHRFLIDVSGSFVDSDVPNVIYDGMWEHNTSTGVKTFKPVTFNFSGGVVAPLQAQVPYRSDHHYSFTVEKTGNNANGILTVDNGSAAVPNITGTVTVNIKDLGQFIS
jgi:hypothetical protein